MKYLKSMFFTILLSIVSVTGYAQTPDEVTLTVSSDGLTKEEATKNALRSAIEQAYGTFVSANTTILNDELVKDEIVTIANGNIKSYEEISSTAMPDGSQFVTLKATVSVSKLISYAQSKGAETEFAGATFGMNLRLQEMNKENEKKVLDNLMAQIKAMLPYTYDRTLEVSDPVIDKNDASLLEIKFVVTNTPNNNMTELQKLIETTLRLISLSDSEQEQYRKSGLKYYKRGELRHNSYDNIYISCLRNPNDSWFVEFFRLMATELLQFRIIDNQMDTSYIEPQFHFVEQVFDGEFTTAYQASVYGDAVSWIPQSRISQSLSYRGHQNYKYYGLIKKGSIDHLSRLPIYKLIKCSMTRFDAFEYRRGFHIPPPVPEPIAITVLGRIPVSDIAKYNNFRVERSVLKYN